MTGFKKKVTSPRSGVDGRSMSNDPIRAATTRVMCVEGRRATGGRWCAAISRLRMYFRFDNSISAPAVRSLEVRDRGKIIRAASVVFRRRFIDLQRTKRKERERERDKRKGEEKEKQRINGVSPTALIPVYLCVKRTRASSGARNNALSNDVKNGKNFQTGGIEDSAAVLNGTRVILSHVQKS